MTSITQQKVQTSHGTIAANISPGSASPALLTIHGNSSCSNIFKHITASPLASNFKTINIDLPGHGDSSDAPHPDQSYTQKAYADMAFQVLEHLGIARVVVLGWSLGGHIAIELMERCRGTGVRLVGIMIVGTPPIPHGDPGAGFKGMEAGALVAFKETLSSEEKDLFAQSSAGEPYEAWMRDAVERTDGRARRIMFDAMAGGRDSDQRALVETHKDVLVAVVNGRDEPFVHIDYIASLRFANLWRGRCFELEGLKHAPFWEQPGAFQPYLDDFMADCASV